MQTLSTIIDELVTTSMKCYIAIDNHGDMKFSPEERLDWSYKVRTLNSRRNELMQEIDEFLDKAIKGEVKITKPLIKMYKGVGGNG